MARTHRVEDGPLGGAVISQQIAARLLDEIRDGAYSAETKLPAEVELAANLGVSRTVIRDALAELEREGYVERVRGIGTVINRQVAALRRRLDQKFEYNAMIQAMGRTPHADHISVQRLDADEALAARLALEPGQPVLMIKKRVLADRQPVIWSVDYLPAALFPPALLDRLDFGRPVFDVMEEASGVSVVSTVAHVSAVLGDPASRRILAVQPHEALLLLEEVSYTKLAKPVMYSLSYYTTFFDFALLRKKF